MSGTELLIMIILVELVIIVGLVLATVLILSGRRRRREKRAAENLAQRVRSEEPCTGGNGQSVISGAGGDIDPALQRPARISGICRGRFARNGIGRAKRLETAQPHAGALILQPKLANPKAGRQCSIVAQGRWRMGRAAAQQVGHVTRIGEREQLCPRQPRPTPRVLQILAHTRPLDTLNRLTRAMPGRSEI